MSRQVLRGTADANSGFDRLTRTASSSRLRRARPWWTSYLHQARRSRNHQSAAQRWKGEAVSSETSPTSDLGLQTRRSGRRTLATNTRSSSTGATRTWRSTPKCPSCPVARRWWFVCRGVGKRRSRDPAMDRDGERARPSHSGAEGAFEVRVAFAAPIRRRRALSTSRRLTCPSSTSSAPRWWAPPVRTRRAPYGSPAWRAA